jgi:hypothetical protein
MLQIVALFLLVVLLLGLVGKLRRGGSGGRLGGPKDQRHLKTPGKCPRCGRFLIGSATCDCGRKG